MCHFKKFIQFRYPSSGWRWWNFHRDPHQQGHQRAEVSGCGEALAVGYTLT